MTTWVVTRHPGSQQWLSQQGIQADRVVDDLDIDVPQPGDIIIGVLPINHVATLNKRGVRYLHLSLNTPISLRGQELSPAQIDQLQGHLQEYQVHKVPEPLFFKAQNAVNKQPEGG